MSIFEVFFHQKDQPPLLYLSMSSEMSHREHAFSPATTRPAGLHCYVTSVVFFVEMGSDGGDSKVVFGTKCSGFAPITLSKAWTVDKLLLVHK